MGEFEEVGAADPGGLAGFEAGDEAGDLEVGVGGAGGVEDGILRGLKGECGDGGDHGRAREEEGADRMVGHSLLCGGIGVVGRVKSKVRRLSGGTRKRAC